MLRMQSLADKRRSLVRPVRGEYCKDQVKVACQVSGLNSGRMVLPSGEMRNTGLKQVWGYLDTGSGVLDMWR